MLYLIVNIYRWVSNMRYYNFLFLIIYSSFNVNQNYNVFFKKKQFCTQNSHSSRYFISTESIPKNMHHNIKCKCDISSDLFFHKKIIFISKISDEYDLTEEEINCSISLIVFHS
jgi:hypothetical protein